MSLPPAVRPPTAIADPNAPQNVLRPSADGGISISSAADAVAITPSDTTALTDVLGLWVGGAGALTVTVASGDVVFSAVPAGSLIPLTVTKVKAATTATAIVAFKSA